MVLATDAVLHVVKYNKVKIISGDMNLAGANFDGYSIFARIYHDVFVTDNKRFALYTHVGGFDTTVTNKLHIELDGDRKITRIVSFPAEKLTKYYTSTKTYAEGDDFTKGTEDTQVRIGSTLEEGAVVYAVADGKVLVKKTIA